MGLKVIGAGFGRTGTLSLKQALEELGFGPCYHMIEVAKDPDHIEFWVQAHREGGAKWDLVFADYQAAVDWPSCNFWENQLECYPDAKVILSVRDPERWYASVMDTIYPASVAWRKSGGAQPSMAFELIWDGVFNGRMQDKQYVIGKYLEHNQKVRDVVPQNRLLEFEPSDGWNSLCEFLGTAVPEMEYPMVNSREDFLKSFGN